MELHEKMHSQKNKTLRQNAQTVGLGGSPTEMSP